MDVLFNMRKDLTTKCLLVDAKSKEELNALMRKKENYALIVDSLIRIAENDKDFIFCISTRIKQLKTIIEEKFNSEEHYELGEREEIVLQYLNQALENSPKEIASKRRRYEWGCLDYLKLVVEEKSYKSFIELVKKEFDILVSQYYTDDLSSRVYLERSPSFLVMANELIRAYGTNLPSELLVYMESIIKGGAKDRLLDHMYTKKFNKLQSNTLKNIRRLSGIIEEEKILSKKKHI